MSKQYIEKASHLKVNICFKWLGWNSTQRVLRFPAYQCEVFRPASNKVLFQKPDQNRRNKLVITWTAAIYSWFILQYSPLPEICLCSSNPAENVCSLKRRCRYRLWNFKCHHIHQHFMAGNLVFCFQIWEGWYIHELKVEHEVRQSPSAPIHIIIKNVLLDHESNRWLLDGCVSGDNMTEFIVMRRLMCIVAWMRLCMESIISIRL